MKSFGRDRAIADSQKILNKEYEISDLEQISNKNSNIRIEIY